VGSCWLGAATRSFAINIRFVGSIGVSAAHSLSQIGWTSSGSSAALHLWRTQSEARTRSRRKRPEDVKRYRRFKKHPSALYALVKVSRGRQAKGAEKRMFFRRILTAHRPLILGLADRIATCADAASTLRRQGSYPLISAELQSVRRKTPGVRSLMRFPIPAFADDLFRRWKRVRFGHITDCKSTAE